MILHRWEQILHTFPGGTFEQSADPKEIIHPTCILDMTALVAEEGGKILACISVKGQVVVEARAYLEAGKPPRNGPYCSTKFDGGRGRVTLGYADRWICYGEHPDIDGPFEIMEKK